MIRITQTLPLLGLCALLLGTGSCTSNESPLSDTGGTFRLLTRVEAFEGDVQTRVNLEGTNFEDGDRIRLKIICPYSTHTEYGESTYGSTYDAYWLLKYNNGQWETGGGSSVGSQPEAQQTPYVFTASTWTEEVVFRNANTGTGSIHYYSPVFHADQRREADYKASDLLWAQTVMQTGTDQVTLSFRHVMACLHVTVTPEAGTTLTDDAVLTLEGVPDIDQTEVVVGNYYAGKSKVNSNGDFGYKKLYACSQTGNGQVLGIRVVTNSGCQVLPMQGNTPDDQSSQTGGTVANSGIYTAYKVSNTEYRLIVPPCQLAAETVILTLCDGEQRWQTKLARTIFEQGKCYAIPLTLSTPTTP